MDMLVKVLQVLITVLMCGSIIILFDIFSLWHEKPEIKLTDKSFKRQKQSLDNIVAYYKGDKGNYIAREMSNAKNILQATRRTSEFYKTIASCVVFAIVGAAVGFLLKNVFAIVALAFGGFMVPIWRLKIYYQKYQKYLSMQLESSVSLITTAYIRTNDIIEAVEDNIENISDLIRPYFEEFLTEYKINPNMKRCIRNLQNKINEPIFKEWCETLIKSYENSEIKENLLSTVEKYSAVRIVQDDLDAETSSALIEYIIMLVVMVAVYPMIKILNSEWFHTFSTLPGKICVGYSIIVGIYSIKKIIDLTAPVQYKR